ncbi:MAG TPA: response regulator [bacterium]|nr:response regulator [bacterium]HOL47998.1 response regulator [bacterium]HPQ18596.1 response regulator [bacterium]
MEEKKKILIIDDDDDFRKILNNYLISLGYETYEAENGLEGFYTMRKKGILPDLIILDIIMEELDGIETYNIIKESEEINEIPILFVSGTEIYHKFKEKTGFKNINFMAKPIQFTILKSLLEKILNKKSKKRK